MNFPEQLKTTTEKAYSSWGGAENLSDEERKIKFRRAVRVTAKYGSDLRKEVHSGELSWYSDAGKGSVGKANTQGHCSILSLAFFCAR